MRVGASLLASPGGVYAGARTRSAPFDLRLPPSPFGVDQTSVLNIT